VSNLARIPGTMGTEAAGRASAIRDLLELVRFSHTVFALPFALLAALLAWAVPANPATSFSWRTLAGIVVAMVGARSAAMAWNRIVDRKIDAANPRTAGRHLPAGRMPVWLAVRFMLVSVVVFLAGTLMFWPNWLPAAVALPVLAVLLGYSHAKRFTALCHVWLGLALGLAPVCAWLAVRGEAVLANAGDLVPAVILGLTVLTWVSGFDILYACQDTDFDRAHGLHSIPALVGVAAALRISAAFHVATVAGLAGLAFSHRLGGPDLGLGSLWLVGIVLIAGLLVWEHGLVSARDLSRVNAAFFNVNAVVSIGTLILGCLEMWW
jgi:4-hydroxybenzoate polyprenyltransferase